MRFSSCKVKLLFSCPVLWLISTNRIQLGCSIKKSILDSFRLETGYHLTCKSHIPELEELWQFSLLFCTAHLADLAVYYENFCFSASHWSVGGFAKKNLFFLAHPPTLTSVLSTKTKILTVHYQISKVCSKKLQKKNCQNSSRLRMCFYRCIETSFPSKFGQKRIISKYNCIFICIAPQIMLERMLDWKN